MILPPRPLPSLPCLSMCRAAARDISQDWVTLASITSRKSSGLWSTIFDTLLRPEATTRMSSRPKAVAAAATIASQFSAELGRFATIAVTIVLLRPGAWHSAATFLSSSSRLAASTTLAPAPASTLAASEPNAPDAPVTMAVLPLMSNREAGFFRQSSDMGWSFLFPPRLRGGWPSEARSGGAHRPCRGKNPTPALPPDGEGEENSIRRGHRHHRGHSIVAAVDELALLIGRDEAAVVGLEHGLLAPRDRRQLTRKHPVHLLGGRGVGAGAAAGQEVREADHELLRPAGVESKQAQRRVATVISRTVCLRLGK